MTVPTAVTFAVSDIASSTPAAAASVTASSIVLSTALKQLRISLQANAASFTPPSGAITWNASDVDLERRELDQCDRGQAAR